MASPIHFTKPVTGTAKSPLLSPASSGVDSPGRWSSPVRKTPILQSIRVSALSPGGGSGGDTGAVRRGAGENDTNEAPPCKRPDRSIKLISVVADTA